MNNVLLYCRPGFEKECATEMSEKAAQKKISGNAQIKENTGYVLFSCNRDEEAGHLMQDIAFGELIFSRQRVRVGKLLSSLSPEDRISPIIAMLSDMPEQAGQLRVEVPDTNSSKTLLKFCRKLTVPLRNALRARKLLLIQENLQRPVIHVFFIAPGCCYVGYSLHNNNSPFYMGIPRLKLSAEAPSRSTLKLEEAFHLFIPMDEWEHRLASGMHAVDLGASPGGWTYQLVRRSMIVHAVDNGTMAKSLMEGGQVIHHQVDGFKFKPRRRNIYWLVCDLVEKPARVAQLMTDWLLKGWCREAIFNLKLPMKKRYEAVTQNILMIRKQLEQHDIHAHIQAKQLYHDREEITVHVRRIWPASRERLDERQMPW